MQVIDEVALLNCCTLTICPDAAFAKVRPGKGGNHLIPIDGTDCIGIMGDDSPTVAGLL